MDIHEVENMSFADLKAKRTELLKVLYVAPADQLAERYLQARTDARGRDEKLAEQAKTLADLHEGLEAVKERAAAATRSATAAMETMQDEADKFRGAADATIVDLKQAIEEHKTANDGLQMRNATLNIKTDELAARCVRLKAQAEKHADAITTIQKVATDAIASRELDQADTGE